MMRTASLFVLLVLTAPPVAALVCELVLCRQAHHDARASDDCHGHGDGPAGPSWSGTAAACHDASDGLADAVVASAAPLVAAVPVASTPLGSAATAILSAHVLARPRAGPSLSLLAATHLRI